MAALVQQQTRAFVATKATSARQSRRVAVVRASQQADAPAAPLRFLAAGLAAAALSTATPAMAGVVLVQPEVKNFVKDTPAPAKSSSAPAAEPAAKKAAYKEESSAPGSGFEAIRPLVLPLSLLVVAGGGAALYKADPGFAEMMVEAGAKDSRLYAGYETSPGLKDTPFFNGGVSNPSPKAAGTQKKKVTVKAGTAKKNTGTGTTKKGLGSLFGSRD